MSPKISGKILLLALLLSAALFGLVIFAFTYCPIILIAIIFVPWLLAALAEGVNI